jgi:hypothetical protein
MSRPLKRTVPAVGSQLRHKSAGSGPRAPLDPHQPTRAAVILGFHRQHAMAGFGRGAWNIHQWFASVQPYFRHFAGLHIFQQQLGFDESERADFRGYIKNPDAEIIAHDAISNFGAIRIAVQ